MRTAIVTGAAGLIGSESVTRLVAHDFRVVGIDNNARQTFFGPEASTEWRRQELERTLRGYTHHHVDIRDEGRVNDIFREHGSRIELVIHAAAQPSHDWAARAPAVDFSINTHGTMVLLETTRRWSPDATFIFTSSNKVYGEYPNHLPLVETETRWELDPADPRWEHGIDETASIDQTRHSVFGASKLAADVLVQEYGRYFGMKTACFRCGCITGPAHSATADHGFLAYLVRCAVSGTPYTIYGYKGKQVRDNLHVCDLVDMFLAFSRNPRRGEVYNTGGGRTHSCSVLEAVALIERVVGKAIDVHYSETNRLGDHLWWITDARKFRSHYPEWSCTYDLEATLSDIRNSPTTRMRGRDPAAGPTTDR